MTITPVIQKLAQRVIRAEIAARNAKNVQRVEDEISTRIRIGSEGDILVVDKYGAPEMGKTFESFLDDVAKDRPELFGGKASNASADNPFAKGPGFSISKQMVLINADRERAEHLAAEAGVTLGKGL